MAKPGEYELAPEIGTPASVRLEVLKTARFIAVRNLATYIYKRGNDPLMTFQESLDQRPKVIETVLAYEIEAGWIPNDLTQSPSPQQPQDGAQQQNGVPQMSQNPQQPAFVPMQPQNGFQPGPAPQQMQQPQVQMQQPQMQQPQQQMMAAPQMGQPQMQQPQMQQPQQQMQATPQQVAAVPEGGKRQRRTAGAAVAPPPAAPPANPSQNFVPGPQPSYGTPPGAPMAQQGFAPGPQMQQPQMQQPSFQPGPAPQQMQPQVQSAPQASIGSDVTARIDQIGAGLSTVSRDVDALKQQNAKLLTLCTQLLAVAHHQYMTNTTLSQQFGQQLANVKTLGDFQNFLSTFTG